MIKQLLPPTQPRDRPAAKPAASPVTDTGASILAMMEEVWAMIPEEEMAKLPRDLAPLFSGRPLGQVRLPTGCPGLSDL